MYYKNCFTHIRMMSVLPTVVFVVLFMVANVGASFAQDVVPVGSREYKVMLKAYSFNGSIEGSLPEKVNSLEQLLADKISEIQLPLDGSFGDTPEENRNVRFWDTENNDLRSHGYVLRERGDLDLETMTPKEGKTKYALKFRSPDQFIAARKDVLLNEDKYNLSKIKYKFEEDITPIIATISFGRFSKKVTNQTGRKIDTKNNWRSLFSFSGTGRDKDDAVNLTTLSDAVDLYPGLSNGLLEEGYAFDEDAAPALMVVSGITVYERTFEGISIDLGDGVNAELVLTLWYNLESTAYNRPMVAELSFDYARIDDDILVGTANAARNAKLLFETIMGIRLVDISSSTKTAAIYSYNH